MESATGPMKTILYTMIYEFWPISAEIAHTVPIIVVYMMTRWVYWALKCLNCILRCSRELFQDLKHAGRRVVIELERLYKSNATFNHFGIFVFRRIVHSTT